MINNRIKKIRMKLQNDYTQMNKNDYNDWNLEGNLKIQL